MRGTRPGTRVHQVVTTSPPPSCPRTGRTLAGSGQMEIESNSRRKQQMTRRGFLISTFAIVVALAAGISAANGSKQRTTAATLSGAGSSFVYPLVSTWEPAFKSASGIGVGYQPIGSGAGIKA